MPYDFRAPRLYVDTDLAEDRTVEPGRGQANYLLNVLRLRRGDGILLFNGRDGEWRARLSGAGRKSCVLVVQEQVREQPAAARLHYLFAPLKQARLDYMVQKAVEMGVGRLTPVLTDYTQVRRVNGERMRANAIEAAEQCGILTIPDIDQPARLAEVLARWQGNRRLIFADEGAVAVSPLATLEGLGGAPLALLVGPEGGFSPPEREALLALPFVTAISLGPRVLRADTAAVAALAVIQAALGDWRSDAEPTK